MSKLSEPQVKCRDRCVGHAHPEHIMQLAQVFQRELAFVKSNGECLSLEN